MTCPMEVQGIALPNIIITPTVSSTVLILFTVPFLWMTSLGLLAAPTLCLPGSYLIFILC